MSCFSCLVDDDHHGKHGPGEMNRMELLIENYFKKNNTGRGRKKKKQDRGESKTDAAISFGFRELEWATDTFKEANLIGEGGFGRVYKGRLLTGQACIHVVAVKQLNHDGHQGFQEFVTEVLMLSLLHHSNLVNLIGYCTDGEQRLLVYEYMPMGSLEDHLFAADPTLNNNKEGGLSWITRMKIAAGAARGLEYLHCKANPPVIYRDLKSANILLDNDFNPKLSDFGLAKLGPVGDNTHVSTRVMGTYGYCAPEYAMSGKLTLKSDIYSFGVVLLELITGRKAMDFTRKQGSQNLVSWARAFLSDRKKFRQMVDPRLRGSYPVRCMHHAICITAMCLQDQPIFRPHVRDIVAALDYIVSQSILELDKHGRLSDTNSSQQEPQPQIATS
ncbi:hypothetical protein Ahy_A06g026157 [Arachis hypogaea]|uniref:Protein kinase domain-containing protein n=1 Tax=Arachis hypogaea TaxID=3818 RepID=A0A445CJK0_ARAHY|nr:hypothetical protein Ahy_A06g026157 [Arachis hypogaea]